MHLTHETNDPIIWTGIALRRFHGPATREAAGAHGLVRRRSDVIAPFAGHRNHGAAALADAALALATSPVGRPSPYRGALAVGLRALIAASRAIEVYLGRALLRYQQHRKARAVRNALRGLDDRMLRDLGFHRDEIESVAAEISGQAERTRVHSLLEPPGFC